MNLEKIQKFLNDIPKPDEKVCFAMGYDSEVNGADEKNCHFSLFSSVERTRAWERGKEQAVKDRQRPTKRAPDARKSALKKVSSNKKGSAKPARG